MLANTDVIDAVQELNSRIYEKLDEPYYAFEARFDGDYTYVYFLGNCIWNSDEDMRDVIDEEEDIREPLIDFLGREAAHEITKLAQLTEVFACGDEAEEEP